MQLWTELKQAVASGAEVRTHSGTVQAGDVFVAMPGTRRHGAEFIAEALRRGAGYVLSDREIPAEARDLSGCCLQVPDVRDALAQLARIRFQTASLPVTLVGVTGTNGKTTVCYLLEHLLGRAGRSVGVLGTISYRWPGHEETAGLTTPDCLSVHCLLARMSREGTDTVCMEVSSHGLEQKRVAGLYFDAALFTNLSPEHLDYHQDMESYFLSKSLLFTEYLAPGGPAVLNLDDAHGRRLATMCPHVLGYSMDSSLDSEHPVLYGELQRADRKGLVMRMSYGDRSWSVRSRLIGRHNASNLLAVQAMGLALGLSEDAFSCLESFSGVPGRLEWVENERGLHVFVDYAHTPDALENILSALADLDYGRIMVLFGCGGDRDRSKRPVMGRVVSQYADVAFLTSDNPRSEDPERIMDDVEPGLEGAVEVIRDADRERAIRAALDRLGPGDVLLIAGKGHETHQEVQGKKLPFHDGQAVLDYLHCGKGEGC
ncbi:MAG: UDP-N-acetylmuramoyl-L-alanyl-D-glutamate--2,6-diaminopimelate ligase [Desulfohalobiaceae bacterium]|nr:UDP-N-acetylmuramoyl-L-alanyl-D-glutamate--2,6-diaminopimelate ligase [Desulfohalobiaceae bacterium]